MWSKNRGFKNDSHGKTTILAFKNAMPVKLRTLTKSLSNSLFMLLLKKDSWLKIVQATYKRTLYCCTALLFGMNSS